MQPQPEPVPTRSVVSTLLLLLVVPCIIFAAFVLWARAEYPGLSKPDPPGQPGRLVWGEDVLSCEPEMRLWLSAHGGSYRRWQRRHPAAVRLVKATELRRAHARAAAKRKKAAAAAAAKQRKG